MRENNERGDHHCATIRIENEGNKSARVKNNRGMIMNSGADATSSSSDNAIYTIPASTSSYNRIIKVILRPSPARQFIGTNIVVARYLLERPLLLPLLPHS